MCHTISDAGARGLPQCARRAALHVAGASSRPAAMSPTMPPTQRDRRPSSTFLEQRENRQRTNTVLPAARAFVASCRQLKVFQSAPHFLSYGTRP